MKLIRSPRSASGFSLVEIMVGMVIGLLGILIMMQIFTNAESQKRTTMGAGDAQSNGALAIYTLQRDIRQAGYGFNALTAMGCPLVLPAPASRTLSQLAPVIINPPTTDIPAGDANTDRLLVAYGSSEGSPEGDAITAVSGSMLGVQTPTNFRVNHRVFAAPGLGASACNLVMASVTGVSAPNVTVAGTGAVDGGALFNLGLAPRFLAYAVRAGNLTVCDYSVANCGAACTAADGSCSGNWTPIASNIVSLRAQYGRDTNAVKDGVIDLWDQTTPPAYTSPTPAPAIPNDVACLWARASAIRLAVVARSAEVDNQVATGAAPTWDGSAAAPINLSARANWQNFRYRTFETVIPLRNLPWMATC